MDLAFGGAGSDSAPRHEVPDVLRRDRVEILGSRTDTEIDDVGKQLARRSQSFVDPEAAVEARIVDQALPPDGGSRFLEIDAHQNAKITGELGCDCREIGCVVDGCSWIMD